jgi:hypothetical protein
MGELSGSPFLLEKDMADRLLRHKPSGQLFIYQAAFAENPEFEEIIDVESREIPEPVEEKPKATRKKPVETVTPRSVEEQVSADTP